MIALFLLLLSLFLPVGSQVSGEAGKVRVSSPEPAEVVLEPEVTKTRKVEPPPDPAPASPAGPTLYEASTTVLESEDHGPMLCLGGIMDSYPPQCGNVPIDGWDWDEVGREETANGTTWGTYHVRGTYEEGRFRIVSTGRPRREPGRDYDFSPACADRSVSDPSKTSDQNLESATIYSNNQRDVSAVWLSYVRSGSGTRRELLNAAFTGRLAHHEEQLRKRWGGPLCVVRYETSLGQLKRIQRRLGDTKGVRNLMLWSDINQVDSYVEIHLIVLTEELEAKLARRYGDLVKATGALQPVR